MITARLVGDDAVLAWLRAAPDLVASGLGRAITTLGIELQRKIQENKLTGQTLAARSGSLESSSKSANRSERQQNCSDGLQRQRIYTRSQFCWCG